MAGRIHFVGQVFLVRREQKDLMATLHHPACQIDLAYRDKSGAALWGRRKEDSNFDELAALIFRLKSPQPLLRMERLYESEDHAEFFVCGAGNGV